MPRWSDTDVVLWYVFGIHHITRVEDWPIMPADIISFWLKPFGFFDANPSLDAPSRSSTGGHGHPDHRTMMVIEPTRRSTAMTEKQVLTNIIDGEERAGRLRRRARHRQPVDRRGVCDVTQLGRRGRRRSVPGGRRTPSRSTAGPRPASGRSTCCGWPT